MLDGHLPWIFHISYNVALVRRWRDVFASGWGAVVAKNLYVVAKHRGGAVIAVVVAGSHEERLIA
jgi:hypothetical protein